jgi:NADH-quinone oxidoreductase subunit L
VAVIGAVTLLTAGFSALVQSDIKRALAYSTMSQVGYMFLALGVGAWSSALFHFATHAFFKALLFLAAGAVILSVHHEQNMFKMGGLRSRIPFIFSVFLVGSASLAALPMLTDGFYSKDLILWGAWASPLGGKWFWLAGFIGAFITALYSFRMLFLVFWGPIKTEAQDVCGLAMKIPLGILAVCCFALGFIERPDIFAHVHYFTDFIRQTLPDVPMKGTHHTELMLMTMAGAASLAGICVAYALYVRAPKAPARLIAYPPGAALHRFWFIGWGFDVLYSVIFIRPMMWAAKNGRQDIVDVLYQFIAKAARSTHKALSGTQTGMVRNYAAGIAIGAVLLIAFLVMS